MQANEAPNTSSPDYDQSYLTLVAKGDEEAFAVLFRKHYKQVYLLALRYLRDKDLAKDVLQDVFSKIWLARTRLNGELSFRSYLYATTRNHIMNIFREDKKARKKIVDYEMEYEESEQVQELMEKRDVLDEAIEKLPKSRRVIIKLKIWKAYTNLQIAQRLKISVPTVKTQYSLAVKQLRKWLL